MADAKPTEALKLEAQTGVLKPWILPAANNFIKDKADLLLTTEKDGMRLQEFTDFLSDIYLLCIKMKIIPDENALKKFILEKLGKKAEG